MIDTHVHLDADQYAEPSGVIKRAHDAGVTAMVVPGTGGTSNRRVLELAGQFSGVVYPAIGCHPERFDLTDSDVDDALALIRSERASLCAVGEVGMPWYGDRARDPKVVDRAKKVLKRFAQAAVEGDLAIIIHAPHDAAREALEILRAAKVRRAVFHWHKSDDATTRAILESDYFISLTPEVAYRDRDIRLAKMVPLSNMLLETDGPWPHGGLFEGRATEPAMIVDAVDAVARILNLRRNRVEARTTHNARFLFGIPP